MTTVTYGHKCRSCKAAGLAEHECRFTSQQRGNGAKCTRCGSTDTHRDWMTAPKSYWRISKGDASEPR